MDTYEDGNLKILAAGPAGSFANNIYVVVDRETNEAAFIDAPDEPEKAIAVAESTGVTPKTILLTHSHGDHTAGIDALQDKYGCKLVAGTREVGLRPGQPDQAVDHGNHVKVGNLVFRVLSVPGHTPGSTTFV